MFSCNIPCKGDGCFVAWQCRTYLTLDVFYPVVTSYKIMAYKLGDSKLQYRINVDFEGKKQQFKVIGPSQQFKLNDNSISVNSFFKSKFNDQLVAFLVNHEGKILKAVNNEAFFVKDLDDIESIFPFKCNKIPFGKFVDYCLWDKNSLSFRKYDHVDDLYKTMLQELGHVNHLNSHYLQLEISNRTIYSDRFEHLDADVRRSQEGKYIEYGTVIKELGNLDGFINMEIILNTEIITQDSQWEKKKFQDIQLKSKCFLVFHVIEGSKMEIEFVKYIPDIFVSLEWCVLTCQNSLEKKIDKTITLPFTVSTQFFTASVILRSGNLHEKK